MRLRRAIDITRRHTVANIDSGTRVLCSYVCAQMLLRDPDAWSPLSYYRSLEKGVAGWRGRGGVYIKSWTSGRQTQTQTQTCTLRSTPRPPSACLPGGPQSLPYVSPWQRRLAKISSARPTWARPRVHACRTETTRHKSTRHRDPKATKVFYVDITGVRVLQKCVVCIGCWTTPHVCLQRGVVC